MDATTTQTTYAVVDAPGHFGEHATVWGAFNNLHEARGFARSGGCQVVTGCTHAKGDKIARGTLLDMIESGFWKVVK